MVALTGDGTGMIHGGDGTAVLPSGLRFTCPGAEKVTLSRLTPDTPAATEGIEGTVGTRPDRAELQQHPHLQPICAHAAAPGGAIAAPARLTLPSPARGSGECPKHLCNRL